MPDSLRNESAIKHMLEYCVEIERTLSEISYDREKYDQSSTHRNALALCVLQIGELVGVLTDDFKAKRRLTQKNTSSNIWNITDCPGW